jgi:tRNA pseudouridine55 synthase
MRECGRKEKMLLKNPNMRGFLLVDKGKGMTSFDVVYKARKWAQEKRVGHAGTLDPLATGLLIVAIGEATKVLEYLIGFDKEYEVTGRFGAVSDTFDAEGKIEVLNENEMKKYEKMTMKPFEKDVLPKFLGEINQVPPRYSALKIDGKRAMDLARDGKEFEMKSRKVMIYDLKIEKFEWPEVVIKVKCGSGTYIRSLINDMGEVIGCGAYVKELRRVSIDRYNVENAIQISRDFDFVNKNIEQSLVSLEKMLEHWPKIDLTDEEFSLLKNGGAVSYNKVEHDGVFLAYYKGKIVGILESGRDSGTIKFRKQIFA